MKVKCGFVRSLLTGLFSFLWLIQAQAQIKATCEGIDLRGAIDSAELEKIKDDVKRIPNSQGRFWKIEKSGIAPSWLLGTMHVTDRRVRQLTQVEQTAFDAAQRVALELDEILDPSATAALKILGHTKKFTYLEDNVLKNTLPASQFAMFEEALESRGLSYALLSRTKPWLIWATMNQTPCMAQGGIPFDIVLGKWAQADDKEVVGLEKIDEQLAAIDALPLNFHVTSVIQLAKLSDRLDDYHETMISLYLDGEIGSIMPTMMSLMRRDLEERGLGDAEMPNSVDMLNFEAILLDERNVIMAQRAAPLLEEGNSFIAVGALHLVGETGLVEQFRRMGYQVTRITAQSQ